MRTRGRGSNLRTSYLELASPSVSESAVGYDDDEDSLEYEDDENARLLDVCIDGDADDLVALLEEMAADGEALSEEMLNYPDQSGRVSQLSVGFGLGFL